MPRYQDLHHGLLAIPALIRALQNKTKGVSINSKGSDSFPTFWAERIQLFLDFLKMGIYITPVATTSCGFRRAALPNI